MKGLQCPVCNTKLSSVIETRGRFRKRKCFNDHTFKTEECVVEVKRPEVLRAQVLTLLASNVGLTPGAPGYISHQKAAQQLCISADTVRRIANSEPANADAATHSLKEL